MSFRVGLGVPFTEYLIKFYKLSDILCNNIDGVTGGFVPSTRQSDWYGLLQDKLENE